MNQKRIRLSHHPKRNVRFKQDIQTRISALPSLGVSMIKSEAMPLVSNNPSTGRLIKRYREHTAKDVSALAQAPARG
jgi:hypothetical protein